MDYNSENNQNVDVNVDNNETLGKKLSSEDMAKLADIFKIKSKKEQKNFRALIATAPLTIIFIILSFTLKNQLLPILIAILSGLLTMIFLFTYLTAYEKRKNLINRSDIDEIKKELAGDDVIVFESAQVYLTKSYILSHGAYSSVVRYDDIALIYNERRISKANGIKVDKDNIFMVATLKSGEVVNIVMTDSEQDIHLIGELILQHNPSILLGNNKENKEALKVIKKNYKNEHKK